jgi:hypothetical protein
MDWQGIFQSALPYREFLEKHGTETHRTRWAAVYEKVHLTDEQRLLIGGFVRDMHLVVLTGAWCGDCVNQCPSMQRIAEASSKIHLRFLDREANTELRESLAINLGYRVPVLVTLSEDFSEVSRYGERTLSVYRRMAAERLGPACPVGVRPPEGDHLAAITQDWLNEIERAQLLLRLSPRLRERHGD